MLTNELLFLPSFLSIYSPDVDTDLYKLIMSPQYLTTAHIQVRFINFSLKNTIHSLLEIHPHIHSVTYTFLTTDIFVSNTEGVKVFTFFISNSSRFSKYFSLFEE